MGIYYDRENQRLIYTGHIATSDFWDKAWQSREGLPKLLTGGWRDKTVERITANWLDPQGKPRILEGGCGRGHLVAKLKAMGYDAYGIDYAAATIRAAESWRPDLKVVVGDVRSLPFEDGFFQGYWSVGLIEHEYEGYHKMADEMARVLTPGGWLFLTFPHLSRLRRIKAALGTYEEFKPTTFPRDKFYEYILDHEQVIKEMGQRGFRFKMIYRKNGFKGLKDEAGKWQPILQKINDSPALAAKVVKTAVSGGLSWFSNHTVVLVLQKTSIILKGEEQ